MATHARRTRSPERLWTEDEFLALPESTGRIELLDGELVRQPSASFGHQDVLLALAELLRAWSRTRTPSPTVAISPLDVKLCDGRIVQPDIVVFLDPLPRSVRMPIERVPDLCVEIVSRNRVYDRVTKRVVYAAAGVPEYWTVLPALRLLERWTGDRLATREELRDRLVTPLLPGFELDVAKLLSEA